MTTPPRAAPSPPATPPAAGEARGQRPATARSGHLRIHRRGQHRHGHGARPARRHRDRRAPDRVHQRRRAARVERLLLRAGQRDRAGLGRRARRPTSRCSRGRCSTRTRSRRCSSRPRSSTAVHDGYLSAVFNPLSETAVQATPLILAGLAVALPYQAGLFNIGGQSQFIGGAIMARGSATPSACRSSCTWSSACSAGSSAARCIGWLAGELKARTGAHEVIVTIMLNYVMQYFLAYLLSSQSLLQAPGPATRSPRRSRRTRTCRCSPAPTCASTPAS